MYMYIYIYICVRVCVCIYMYIWRRVTPSVTSCCHTLTPQHTATHCNSLQLTATHCNTLQDSYLMHNIAHPSSFERHQVLQDAATHSHCNTLQHTATHCNTLQHTATHCKTLTWCIILRIPRVSRDTKCYKMLQHTHIATHCNTLQHTATHYKHSHLMHDIAHPSSFERRQVLRYTRG